MTDGHREDAAEKIEVLIPVEIPDVLHFAAVGNERLLKIIGDGGPKVFFVFGDNFLTAGLRRIGHGGSSSRRSGHEIVLSRSLGCRRVYDGGFTPASHTGVRKREAKNQLAKTTGAFKLSQSLFSFFIAFSGSGGEEAVGLIATLGDAVAGHVHVA